jgi:hypothetical protein
VVQPSGSTVYKFDTGRVRLWFGARAALLEAFDPLVAFNPTSRGTQSVSAFDAQGEILALTGFNGFDFSHSVNYLILFVAEVFWYKIMWYVNFVYFSFAFMQW